MANTAAMPRAMVYRRMALFQGGQLAGRLTVTTTSSRDDEPKRSTATREKVCAPPCRILVWVIALAPTETRPSDQRCDRRFASGSVVVEPSSVRSTAQLLDELSVRSGPALAVNRRLASGVSATALKATFMSWPSTSELQIRIAGVEGREQICRHWKC
jgi:hypothetical protein